MIHSQSLRGFWKIGLVVSAVAIFGYGALAQTISDFERKFEIKELQLARVRRPAWSPSAVRQGRLRSAVVRGYLR